MLRVAVQSDVKSLNPLLNSNTTDGLIAFLMFEPLLSADAKGNPVPILATAVPAPENGGVSRDGLTVTYHMRRNAKWTDGVPVTSADVKWSWQAIMNPNNNIVSRHGYDYVKSIDTPNPYTVVVHLKQKFSPFVNTFFAMSDQPMPVAPAHVLSRYPDINQLAFNSRPDVGDGPFKFVEWAHNDHITVERNDKFFMGRPRLRRIEIRIVPDENTTVNQMKTHAIDFMFQASPETYPALKSAPGRRVAVRQRQRLRTNSSEHLAPDARGPAHARGDRVRDRQAPSGGYAHVRPDDAGYGRHPGLDVGVQPDGEELSARPRDGAPAAARAGVASRLRRDHAPQRRSR